MLMEYRYQTAFIYENYKDLQEEYLAHRSEIEYLQRSYETELGFGVFVKTFGNRDTVCIELSIDDVISLADLYFSMRETNDENDDITEDVSPLMYARLRDVPFKQRRRYGNEIRRDESLIPAFETHPCLYLQQRTGPYRSLHLVIAALVVHEKVPIFFVEAQNAWRRNASVPHPMG